MTASRTALVLGGGVGGVAAATRLRKRLRSSDRVVLVDRNEQHLFQPSLLWLAVGTRSASEIQRPFKRLEASGIEIRTGDITGFDLDKRRIQVGDTELSADTVVLALGADLAPERIPGLTAAGHNLYSVDGAAAIHDSLRRFRGGRIVVLTAAPKYKCPAAPYEAALLIKDLLTRRGGRSGIVEMYAAEAMPMGTAGPSVSASVQELLKEAGVGYHPNHQVDRVDPRARTIHFLGGATAAYELLIYVPPHRPPAVISQSGLADDTGWIPVHPHTLRAEPAGVFAVGDVTRVALPGGKFLPKAGTFAKAQAEVVADNIVAEWTGKGSLRTFDGSGACFVETGSGRAAYGAGDFYASPTVSMTFHPPARWWRLGKIALEKYWLWSRF